MPADAKDRSRPVLLWTLLPVLLLARSSVSEPAELPPSLLIVVGLGLTETTGRPVPIGRISGRNVVKEGSEEFLECDTEFGGAA